MAENIKEINSSSEAKDSNDNFGYHVPEDFRVRCNIWEPDREGPMDKIILGHDSCFFLSPPDEEEGAYITVRVMGFEKKENDAEEYKKIKEEYLMIDFGKHIHLHPWDEIYVKVDEEIEIQLEENKKKANQGISQTREEINQGIDQEKKVEQKEGRVPERTQEETDNFIKRMEKVGKNWKNPPPDYND